VTQHPGRSLPQLYMTAPAPCPYLPGRKERKVFTHLIGDDAAHLNDMLSQAGFRRSQNVAYRPACEACEACISVRVRARDADLSKSQKRVLRLNEDLQGEERPARATKEQFGVLRSYLDERHMDGGMSDMTALDFAAMVDDTPVKTRMVEYRLNGRLVACALTDTLVDGLSMVYSFFDPDYPKRGLGTFMILDHLKRARARNLDYVYLGYWVAGCRKMSYKVKFKPLEALGPKGWQDLHNREHRAKPD